MTRPDRRQQAALSSAFAGAIDLSALKNKPAPGAGARAAGAAVEVHDRRHRSHLRRGRPGLDRRCRWSSICGRADPRCPPRCPRCSTRSSRTVTDPGYWPGSTWTPIPRVAQAFQAREIPTIIAVAAGQPVDAYAGPADDTAVREWITALLDALRERMPAITRGRGGGRYRAGTRRRAGGRALHRGRGRTDGR